MLNLIASFSLFFALLFAPANELRVPAQATVPGLAPDATATLLGIPVASDYAGFWSGEFDAPADLWWFIFDIKLAGTYTVYQYYPPTMTWTMKTGTWSLDSSGTLRGLNSVGSPAFSMFPHATNPNLMTAEMVNTQGPGIPGMFVDGVVYP